MAEMNIRALTATQATAALAIVEAIEAELTAAGGAESPSGEQFSQHELDTLKTQIDVVKQALRKLFSLLRGATAPPSSGASGGGTD